jgi:hypothetical protein
MGVLSAGHSAKRDSAQGCDSCAGVRRELDATRERSGLLQHGLGACVALLAKEHDKPTMHKRQLLAVLQHRLDHLMNQTSGRNNR